MPLNMITTLPLLDLQTLYPRPMTKDQNKQVMNRSRSLKIVTQYKNGKLKNKNIITDFDLIQSGQMSPMTPETLDEYLATCNNSLTMEDVKIHMHQRRTRLNSNSNSKNYSRKRINATAKIQSNVKETRMPSALVLWLQSVKHHSLCGAVYPSDLFGSGYTIPHTFKDALQHMEGKNVDIQTTVIIQYGLSLLTIGESNDSVIDQMLSFYYSLISVDIPAVTQGGAVSSANYDMFSELSEFVKGEEGDKIESVVSNVRSMFDSLRDSEVKDSILDMKDSAASIKIASKNIAQIVQDHPELLKNVSDLSGTIASIAPHYAKLHMFWGTHGQYVPFVLAAFLYCMQHVSSDSYNKIFITLGFALMGVITVIFPDTLIKCFYDSFSFVAKAFTATAQTQSGHSDTIVAALSAFVLSGSKLEHLPSAILSKLTGFDKASATFERLYSSVSDFLLDSFEYMSKTVGMPYERDRTDLQIRLKQTGEFIAKFSEKSYKPTIEDYQTCETYARRTSTDIAQYAIGNPALLSLLRDNRSSLQKIDGKLSPLFATSRLSRVEPVFALILGFPGNGKSLLSEIVATRVTGNCLPEADKEQFARNPTTHLYNRVPNKFWEGYHPETFTTRLDDFGQMQEVPGQENSEIMDGIIRAVNTFPYPLNMAFEDKGKMMFNSKFIIATSNFCDITNETVRDKGAVDRRIKFRIVAYPKAQYCLDNTKAEWLREFKPEVKTDEWVVNIQDYLEFKTVVLTPGSRVPYTTGSPILIDELVDRISKTVSDKIRVYNDRFTTTTDNVGSAYSAAFPQEPPVQRHFLDGYDESSHSCRRAFHQYYEGPSLPYPVWIAALEKTYPEFVKLLKNDVDKVVSIKNFLQRQDQSFAKYSFDIDLPLTIYDPELHMPESVWQRAHRTIKASVDSKVIKCCVVGLSLLTAVFIAKKSYSTSLHSQPLQSRTFTSRGLKYAAKESSHLKQSMVQAGTYFDPARSSIVSKAANRNMPQISIMFNDEKQSIHELGYGLYLKDDLMLVPNHFLFNMNEHLKRYNDLDMHVQLTFGVASRTSVYIALADFVKEAVVVDADDLALVRVPRCGLGPKPNTMKYIAKRQDHAKNLKTNGVLTKVRLDSALIEVCTNFSDVEPALNGTSDLFAYIGETPVAYTRVYKYPVATDLGECGMTLSIPNTRNATAKIFGMHVLGCHSGKYGYATKLCYEDIEKAIDDLEQLFECSDILTSEDSMAVAQCGSVSNVKHISHIDTLSHGVASASVSKMEISPFFELYVKSVTTPAILRPFSNDFGSFNPYELGLQKYCINQGYLDVSEVELVCRYLFENLRRCSPNLPQTKALLSIRQACEGVPELGIGPIPKNTSPGYPYVNNPVQNLPYRYRFFGSLPGYNFDNPYFKELEIVVSSAIQNAEKGIRTPWYIIDNLKDEDLPRSKVERGKARIFCAVPLAKLIIDKMYFGAFATWITSNNVDNSIAIGVNPYGNDWEDAARHLYKYPGSQYGAGDFSGFDGSQRGLIHQHICDQINKWYDDGPVNARVRRVLFADVYNSYHIRGDKVFEWVGGMTSGFYLTAHLNSLYNLFAFTRVYAKIVNYAPSEMKLINRYMRVLVMGDDNVYGVHPKLSEFFTEEVLIKSFGEIGLIYTNELKTEKVNTSLREFTALDFCKRSFKYSESLGRYIAPIRLDAIYASLDYFKKGREKVDIEQQLDMIAGEFALHGREVFNNHVPKLIATSELNGLVISYTDYDLAFGHMCEAHISW